MGCLRRYKLFFSVCPFLFFANWKKRHLGGIILHLVKGLYLNVWTCFKKLSVVFNSRPFLNPDHLRPQLLIRWSDFLISSFSCYHSASAKSVGFRCVFHLHAGFITDKGNPIRCASAVVSRQQHRFCLPSPATYFQPSSTVPLRGCTGVA